MENLRHGWKRTILAAAFAIAMIGTPAHSLPVDKIQVKKAPGIPEQTQQFVGIEPTDARNLKNEFDRLLNRYPPTVKGVFKQDPTLMTQQEYLKPYPALANFLGMHPEIALNPAYFLDGVGNDPWQQPRGREDRILGMWDDLEKGLFVVTGFAIAIGLLTWLIRTFLDYRRWNRLSKVQSEVHTKLLDRFSTNEEIMAYISTPAGSKFLQSAPISLDTGAASRSMGAPLSRIMWSLQAGVVLAAAGVGFMVASSRMSRDMYLPLEILGILALAMGAGFAISAGVSYKLSQKMGLLDGAAHKKASDTNEAAS